MLSLGVISDTHGLMREEALHALEGVEMILHAGDVGNTDVLEQLRGIAPVTAISGNVDTGPWARSLPESLTIEIGGVVIHMLHDLKQLELDPVAAGFGLVISGHSHVPLIERRDGVLYLNPGSAGPRRFTLPISLAMLRIDNHQPDATIIDLERGGILRV